MVRRLHYWLSYGSYLRSRHGIKNFAELAIGLLIRKVTKKSAFFREMNENLLVEKANLRLRSDDLLQQSMLDADVFFSIRLRLRSNHIMTAVVAVAGVLLIYVSTITFIQGGTGISSGFLGVLVSTVLAIVLFGSGLLITEHLISSILPPASKNSKFTRSQVTVIWTLLLIIVEMLLFSTSETRAALLSAAQNSTILYVAFVTLVMFLPVIAGALRWDAVRFFDAYKTTCAHHQIDSRLAQIDSILRQNAEYESNHYKVWSTQYWDLLNEFKTIKGRYNHKRDIEEPLNGHFSVSYDAFQAEAQKRYELDIRDLTAKSIRRLEMGIQQKAGNKIGPASTGTNKMQVFPIPDFTEDAEMDALGEQTIATFPEPDTTPDL